MIQKRKSIVRFMLQAVGVLNLTSDTMNLLMVKVLRCRLAIDVETNQV